LERAAVFVLGAVRILCAVGEASLIGARTAGAGNALLCFGTGSVQTGDEALAIDANAGVTALEVELAAERSRLGIVFERIEAESAVRTGRAYRAFGFLLALSDAAERRA
jgi:hypothetical protein